MPQTPRLKLPEPSALDPPNGPEQIAALANALDGAALDDQGTFANRPVSTPSIPGLSGRYYWNTDLQRLDRDNGTGWDAVGGSLSLSGSRSAMPTASSVPVGALFYAVDQDSVWLSTGSAWLRIGQQAGDLIWNLDAVARTGAVALTGQTIARTGVYQDLFTKWGTGYNTGGEAATDFRLPDLGGRTIVVKGTHADVATVGLADGLAAGSRSPKHNHTVVDPTHTHGGPSGNSYATTTGAGSVFAAGTGGGSGAATGAAATGVTVGPGGSRPTDSAAYFVANAFAKL